MQSNPEIVVLGDINLDWLATGNLPFSFSELKENGVIAWTPIVELPGGSGLNFARFAKEQGYLPLLLGKIGDDASGHFLEQWLGQTGIVSGIRKAPSLRTGKAFIIRDKSDIRFLVNTTENANHALSVEDVEAFRQEIASSRMLYVSGYCFMIRDAPRTAATLRAMELALDTRRPKQRHVVFDVVPHRMYEIYSYAEFHALTRHVDILISEVATMRRFLKLGSKDEAIDRPRAEETLEAMKETYGRFILRYGPGGCDTQVACDAEQGKIEWVETSHGEATDKRGYGDLLAVKTIRDFFAI